MKMPPASLISGLLFAAAALGQTPTFSVVYTFPFTVTNTTTGTGYWPQGDVPQGPLLQASDGNFYGTTMSGGDDGQCSKLPTPGNPVPPCAGTVFQLTPAGKLTVLHTFAWGSITAPYADGSTPRGGLVEGPDGYLYGSTNFGGVNAGQQANSGNGVIFRISKTGMFQNIHSFANCALNSCPEGRFPSALVLGRDGKFYGTTQGVATLTTAATIFRISSSGGLETLYNFNNTSDGGGHAPALPLIQGSDCNFYGVGASGVFRFTPGGVLTPLYLTTLANQKTTGYTPSSPVVQASNGKLYGVMSEGGVYSHGTIYELGLDGTFRVVYNLNNPALAGGGPTSALLQASDGNLWGTGSSTPNVTLYALGIASGTLAQSTPFPCAQTSTGTVNGPLIQSMDGKLYGGGSQAPCASATGTGGTIFSIDAGLPKLPNPVVSAVTNGASFVPGSLVPGEIATAFGTSLTTGTGINLSSSLPLPASLLGSEVLVNGCPATPLFAVDNVSGQQQINFQAPWEIAGQQVVAVQVANNGGISPMMGVPVLAEQPGIINFSSGGVTYGAILHADYSLASPTSPVTAGETVLIYGTGLGAVMTPQVDGNAANGESTVAVPTVTIGGAPAMVMFSGLAPGFVGLNQVNVMVPAGLSAGNQPVVMNLGGSGSNTVMVPVH